MKFTFKSYQESKKSSRDKSDEHQNSQQKRREQIRRAQKTHRERKESYTKSLEEEVVQLRANEAKLLLEVNTLYAKLSTFEKLLTDSGIPLPTEFGALDTAQNKESPLPTIELSIRDTKSKNRQKQICIQTPWIKQKQHHDNRRAQPESGPPSLSSAQQSQTRRPVVGAKSGEGYGNTITPSDFSTPLDSNTVPTSNLIISPHTPTCLGELDASVLCMDFVLALESPCLSHIDVEHGHDSPPTGHGFTVSATLLHQRPAESDRHQHSHGAWQVPHCSIERLLELSKNIPLDGEVTPVQAWDYIRRNPQHESLEIERYNSLKEKLLSHVKCYGFGAVIEQSFFENLVFEAFVVGRVF